ncbi:MAG: type II toxin-antitoxin system VapC family toxin [Planctomycetes bacterium]|nr:type II toxin-antitoxin system VapC family toxin [Planctomycetota bacterium]
MNLLLDTHVWLWGLLEPERISKKAREALLAPDAEVHLSPISVFEALLLVERGRVRVPGSAASFVKGALGAGLFIEAPLTVPVAMESRRLAIDVADPADRFLAATAAVYGLTFVTADRRLRRIPGVRILRA